MMHGRNNGKKLMSVRIMQHAFEIIHLLTGEVMLYNYFSIFSSLLFWRKNVHLAERLLFRCILLKNGDLPPLMTSSILSLSLSLSLFCRTPSRFWWTPSSTLAPVRTPLVLVVLVPSAVRLLMSLLSAVWIRYGWCWYEFVQCMKNICTFWIGEVYKAGKFKLSLPCDRMSPLVVFCTSNVHASHIDPRPSSCWPLVPARPPSVTSSPSRSAWLMSSSTLPRARPTPMPSRRRMSSSALRSPTDKCYVTTSTQTVKLFGLS